jgi:hypothetical protein
MPNGAEILPASTVRVKLRVTKGRPPVLQFLLHEIRLDAADFPPGARCVLEASRNLLGSFERIDLGPASALPNLCHDWRDLRLLPVTDFEATSFHFRVIGADHRNLALAENVRATRGEGDGDETDLLSPSIQDARRMGGVLVDVSPEWDGSLPVPIRVSTSVHKAQERLEEGDPELVGMVCSAAVPQLLTRLYVEFGNAEAEEARVAWAELLRRWGYPAEIVARLDDDNTDPAEKCREVMDLSRFLTGRFMETVTSRAEVN